MRNMSSTTSALPVADPILSRCRSAAADDALGGCKSSSDDSIDRSSTGSWFSTSTATVDIGLVRPEVILPSISPTTASAVVVVRPPSTSRSDDDESLSKMSAATPETPRLVVGESSMATLDNDGDSEGVEFSSASQSSRRNKRKMTEPRRRATTDFSIRNICSSSNSDIEVDNDGSNHDDDQTSKRSKRRDDEITTSLPSSITLSDHTSGVVIQPTDMVVPFERPKPFLFYPLNIPMVFTSSNGTTSNRVKSFQTTESASSASVIAASSSRVALTDTVGRRSVPVDGGLRRPSKSEDHIIQNPPNKDRSVVDNVFHLGVDLRSRRKQRIPEVPAVIRHVPLYTTTTRSASASSDACSDDSPARFNMGGSCVDEEASINDGGRAPSPLRKNYKNMTKQRRIEANARERTRVHTISAAFESLRRAVPSYSYNQRLSKLAILRIACSYILALARLADVEPSDDSSSSLVGLESMTFAECVDLCTQTIQTEGKAKRRH